MDELTPIDNSEEIKRIVLSIKSRGEDLLFWQPGKDERQKIQITINSESFILGERLLLFSNDDLSAFKPDEEIYFYYKPQTIIFRSIVKTICNGHMVCEPPTKLQLKESRKLKRFYLERDNKFLAISKKNRNSTPTRFRVSLMDISETGASFLINKSQTESLFEDDTINIHSLDKLIIQPLLGSRICYIVPFKVAGRKTFKVGVEFDRMLTPSEIKEIKGNSA